MFGDGVADTDSFGFVESDRDAVFREEVDGFRVADKPLVRELIRDSRFNFVISSPTFVAIEVCAFSPVEVRSTAMAQYRLSHGYLPL